jgi:glycosyltransferase involved in cell wall biosynthesis
LLYAQNLMTGLARTGVELTVLCLDAREPEPHEVSVGPGRIEWVRLPNRSSGRLLSVFSSLPSASFRIATPEYRENLRKLMERDWDAIIVNQISMGWVLPHLQSRAYGRRGRAPLFFVTHNHETSVKAQVAEAYAGSRFMRAALYYDALKNRRQERRMIRAASVTSAITAADCDQFKREFPDKQFVVLNPGYDGTRVKHRTITSDTPRRVVILGSLDWIGKQQNLRSFLEACNDLFQRKGIEVQVIGFAPPAFVEDVSRWATCARFIGRVPDFTPYLQQARIGVMPDTVGSGFKHKYLSYIFNALPLATIGSQMRDLPVAPGEDVLTADTPLALANTVAAAIDDLGLLNRLQTSALAKCNGLFDWSETARTFRAAIDQMVQTESQTGGAASAESRA